MRKVLGIMLGTIALSLSMATPALAADLDSTRSAAVQYRGVFPTARQCFDQGNAALRNEPALIGFQCRTHWTGQRELWVEYR